MKLIPNGLTSLVGRQALKLDKASPKLLFVGGVVGVVGATVLACKATLQLEDILVEAEERHEMVRQNLARPGEEKKDHVRVSVVAAGKVVKLYGPAIIIGGASIGMLTKSHNIMARRNAALMAAYSALDKGFKEYRARVRDEYGEDKERELRYGAETRPITTVNEDGSKSTEMQRVVNPVTGASIYAKFFDQFSQNWSKEGEYNIIFLNHQQAWANDRLHAQGHLFLNDVYEQLGLPKTSAGQIVGWLVHKDHDNFVDFGIYDGSNYKTRQFVNGLEGAILLDFNVDGVIYDKID